MKPSPRSPRRSLAAGFTLIELLTVIAIIGILAAILIPTVGAVREKAKKMQCLSNMRQWGQAMMLYASENKQKYVINTAASGNGAWWYQVGDSLAIYASYFTMKKDYGTLARCQSEPTEFLSTDHTNVTTCFLMVQPNRLGTPVPLNAIDLTKAQSPSQLLIFVERSFTNGTGFISPSGDLHLYVTQANVMTNADAFTRHNKSMNALFADGHVMNLKANGNTSDSYRGMTGTTFNFQRWTRMD